MGSLAEWQETVKKCLDSPLLSLIFNIKKAISKEEERLVFTKSSFNKAFF